eukprot:TRINITY_DN9210_c0_g1_i1.p1 TRINITY_DN9210_c0_g1~~TRINITY_DN9210_c0_g1_i1.p1  ORF type:complete len:873 (+),score=194.53 TRINITY_DN9210_c0_g1_i1:40-2658(+)
MTENRPINIIKKTSVKDRIQFYEGRITEEETSSMELKKKVLPRRHVRTPRGSGEESDSLSQSCSQSSSSQNFKISRRRFAVLEILSSESSYVKMLQLLVNTFKQPLSRLCKDKKFPDETALNTIFSNIDEILNFNQSLLDKLSIRIKDWEEDTLSRTVGDVFVETVPSMIVYYEYVANYSMALSTFEKAKEKPEFAHWMSEQSSKAGYDFFDLLIVPVQRIPRYRMLIEAVISSTESSHPDHSLLNSALSAIQSIADNLNEHIRKHENQQRMLEISNRMQGWTNLEEGDEGGEFLQPHRRFISEHNLILMDWEDASESESDKEEKSERPVICFVFNDILLLALPLANGVLEYVGHMRHHLLFLKLPFKPAPPLSFQVVSPKDIFKLRPTSEEELRAFKTAVQDARTALLASDSSLGAYRKRISLEKNEWNGEWEAIVSPPVYSVRVTNEQMESESVMETKRALEELLQHNRPVLETKKIQTPIKKKRLDGIKDMVSKFSPLKKRPDHGLRRTLGETEVIDDEEITQAEHLNIEIKRLSELETKIKKELLPTYRVEETEKKQEEKLTPRGASERSDTTEETDKKREDKLTPRGRERSVTNEETEKKRDKGRERSVTNEETDKKREDKLTPRGRDRSDSALQSEARSSHWGKLPVKLSDSLAKPERKDDNRSRSKSPLREKNKSPSKLFSDSLSKPERKDDDRSRSKSPSKAKRGKEDMREESSKIDLFSSAPIKKTNIEQQDKHRKPMREMRKCTKQDSRALKRPHEDAESTTGKSVKEMRKCTKQDSRTLKRSREDVDDHATESSHFHIESGTKTTRKKLKMSTEGQSDKTDLKSHLDMWQETEEQKPNRRRSLSSVSKKALRRSSTIASTK